METIGYARVSAKDQKLDVQLDKLKECDKIFQEKLGGMNMERPQLKLCLEYVRSGDTLVICRLDRLARSTLDLLKIAKELERKGVALRVLDQNIDTSTPTGRLLFSMLGVIGQFETELRAERQREGLLKAKESGIHLGRQYKLSHQQTQELREERANGKTIREIREKYGLSHKSVYNYLNVGKEASHAQ